MTHRNMERNDPEEEPQDTDIDSKEDEPEFPADDPSGIYVP